MLAERKFKEFNREFSRELGTITAPRGVVGFWPACSIVTMMGGCYTFSGQGPALIYICVPDNVVK